MSITPFFRVRPPHMPLSLRSARCPNGQLTDLYPAMDSPQFAEDLARAENDARTFAEDYRGKLATLAAQDLADPNRTF